MIKYSIIMKILKHSLLAVGLLYACSVLAATDTEEARLLRFPSTNGTDIVFSYAGDLENDRPIVKERFPDLDLFGFDSGTGADVVEKGCSKADGMLRICEAFGEDVKDTYAFGDSQNDIAIIERAGTGIAMGNALKELKDHADYVTEPVWNDGIYRACLHFGLIGEMG